MFCGGAAKVMPPPACDVAHSVRSDVLCSAFAERNDKETPKWHDKINLINKWGE